MSREGVIKKYTSGLATSSDYVRGTTPSAPALGPMGTVGSFSAVPGLPSLPSLSSLSSLPSLPSISSFPALGSMGSMGSLPSFSGLGSMFTASTQSPSAQSPSAPSSYFMQVLFYLFLYSFIIFIILVFIHFSVTPVFRFGPGGNGIFPIPGTGNDIVYWNTGAQPDPSVPVPAPTDSLTTYEFINSFSICFDLFVTKITSSGNSQNRLILYKTVDLGTEKPPTAPPSGNIMDYMNTKGASMIVYLANDTNDMVITFFSPDTSGTPLQFSCAPIKNIPMNTPFRVTLVVEKNSFSVYLNAMQVAQRIIPSILSLPPTNSRTGKQKFYAAPDWDQPKTIYIQNFHVWPHPITYPEVQSAQPSLALITDFTGKTPT